MTESDVVPAPYIEILKLLRSARNSSAWKSPNMEMLMLYVSDVSQVGFLCILTLTMLLKRYYSSSTLMGEIGGGYIRACTSALSRYHYGQSSWLDVLVLRNRV